MTVPDGRRETRHRDEVFPDGTVWTGPYPVAPGLPPRAVVVRVRQQGWTSVEFDIEHAYGGPTGTGRGSLPTAAFARRFHRIF